MSIAYMKYCSLGEAASAIERFLHTFSKLKFFEGDEMVVPRMDLLDFIGCLQRDIRDYLSIQISGVLDYNDVDEETRSTFTQAYQEIPNLATIKKLQESYGDLRHYSEYLDKKTCDFIFTMDNTTYQPLTFVRLNFKDHFGEEERSRMLSLFLCKFYDLLKVLDEVLHRPDIDVDKAAGVLIDAIGGMKNVPELGRCKKAFRVLENATSILKNNFRSYHEDFARTKSHFIMIERFIEDVAANNEDDPGLKRELRSIVKYIEKQVEQKGIKDPVVSKALGIIKGSTSEKPT